MMHDCIVPMQIGDLPIKRRELQLHRTHIVRHLVNPAADVAGPLQIQTLGRESNTLRRNPPKHAEGESAQCRWKAAP